MTVRHNLHFFKQYRCYLLMFTELCMNKSNQNQFRTRIVTRVTRVSILVKVVCTSYQVTSLALANTNIQYKQINYDADNIDNNE